MAPSARTITKLINKVAIDPIYHVRNDTVGENSQLQSRYDHGQTGGSRRNPDPGVPNYGSTYFPVPNRPLTSLSKLVKAVVLVQIGKKYKAPLDFKKLLQNRFGNSLVIDFKNKLIKSEKYPKKIVIGWFLTLDETRITELEMLTKQHNLPLLVLRKKKTTI